MNTDCAECNSLVDIMEKLGNDYCDGGKYGLDVCSMDGGDCTTCFSQVANRSKVGDGICDTGDYYLTPSCGYDAGDCQKMFLEQIYNATGGEMWNRKQSWLGVILSA